MKVADLGFNDGQLQRYDTDSFYQTNKDTLIEDFKRLTSDFQAIDLPDDITEEQKKTVRTQVTDQFIMFFIGHLNFLDLESSLCKSLHKPPAIEEKTKLWLPDHLTQK